MIPSITDEYLEYMEQQFYYYQPMLAWTEKQMKKREVPDWLNLDPNGLEEKVEHLRMEIYFLRDELDQHGPRRRI